MKAWKLAVAILVLGTMTISPKADAKNLLKTQQVVAQVPNSQPENSNNAQTYFDRGFKKLELKDYRGAIADFNQVLKIDPNNSYAYIGRGLGNFGLDSYQAAKTDFDKALELTPDIAYAHFFRGLTLAMLADKQGAIADLKKASTLFKQEGDLEFAQRADAAVQKIEAS